MKRFFQTTAFIIAMSAIVIFSRQIQNEIIEGYNHCVNQLASRTVTSNTIVGF
ncbi:hypothetical protein [uncultured Psychroserpens sp.]|uniref:hypothetical protein n=1 Tax=uncultured Psychroserpens sp. TaxID=255436 RepID=UPI0026284F16|nr:hypothetical protein [uncultured Psychroserpens sp.]